MFQVLVGPMSALSLVLFITKSLDYSIDTSNYRNFSLVQHVLFIHGIHLKFLSPQPFFLHIQFAITVVESQYYYHRCCLWMYGRWQNKNIVLFSIRSLLLLLFLVFCFVLLLHSTAVYFQLKPLTRQPSTAINYYFVFDK